ncbi:hypothetical protein E2C01_052720 [Portunus trituberculatus]|uniref:Uncharacterized protein n=1 Tax=Portunus trituberculatus TaxID=210409 RepID=A0A5B7GIF0_PORTR|nr:hypothetical protein [Portunus trituberculatus]
MDERGAPQAGVCRGPPRICFQLYYFFVPQPLRSSASIVFRDLFFISITLLLFSLHQFVDYDMTTLDNLHVMSMIRLLKRFDSLPRILQLVISILFS